MGYYVCKECNTCKGLEIIDMEMAKVTSKGQITIPVSIRKRLGINEGDKLLFIDSPDGVIMVNPDMLPGAQTAAAVGKVGRSPRPGNPA